MDKTFWKLFGVGVASITAAVSLLVGLPWGLLIFGVVFVVTALAYATN